MALMVSCSVSRVGTQRVYRFVLVHVNSNSSSLGWRVDSLPAPRPAHMRGNSASSVPAVLLYVESVGAQQVELGRGCTAC